MKRYFEYVGEPLLTRGDYGVGIRGGHDNGDGAIKIFDPDTGDFVWSSTEAGLESGDWKEITKETWEML